eukprot:2168043-Amphidinium_carterae.1
MNQASQLREVQQNLSKHDCIGAEVSLGLRQGSAVYNIKAARGGCKLIQVPRASVDNALAYFPEEFANMLKCRHIPASSAVDDVRHSYQQRFHDLASMLVRTRL